VKGDKATSNDAKTTPITQKRPLTEREQSMYFRLIEAAPELVVLAQVSFSAMLKTSGTATRNTYDRKTADFVICTRAFDILLVIELDDASHNGQEVKDGKRDATLVQAGIAVVRYKNVPDADALRKDLSELTGKHKVAA
jgi:very-short-patch-repair endonuclease